MQKVEESSDAFLPPIAYELTVLLRFHGPPKAEGWLSGLRHQTDNLAMCCNTSVGSNPTPSATGAQRCPDNRLSPGLQGRSAILGFRLLKMTPSDSRVPSKGPWHLLIFPIFLRRVRLPRVYTGNPSLYLHKYHIYVAKTSHLC